MSELFRDLRFALRVLRRRWGITTIAVVALALGIGANTAIFSVVQGVLLDSLPYRDPDRLMLLWESDLASPDRRLGAMSEATYDDLRRQSRSFETLSAVRNTSYSLTGLDVPETPLVRRVTASYFPNFGVEPMLGRAFVAEEDRPAGPKVTILSHSLWQRVYASDPGVLGKTLELDFEPYEIVGVMPADYRSPLEPAPPQLWVPMAADPASLGRRGRPYLVYGRLVPGVSIEAARQELEGLAIELARLHPETNAGRGLALDPIHHVLTGALRPALLAVLAAVGFVLLIACGNVAHLLLGHAMDRRREIAIRVALGADRWVLLRQLGVESLLLALIGGGLGVALAVFSLDPLVAMIPEGFDIPRLDHVSIDLPVLGFAMGLALATGLLFGLGPAQLALSRTALHDDLSAGSVRSTASRRGKFLRAGLVVGEVALSFVLLIGAGLMLQSFLGLSRADPGFDPEGVLTFRTGLRGEAYAEPWQRVDFFQRVSEELARLPGVSAVAVANRLPPTLPVESEAFTLEGAAPVAEGSEPRALLRVVTPSFFDTLSIPRLQGRGLSTHDTADTPAVALVNQQFAELHLGDGPVLGRGILLGSERIEVVGVVGNVRTVGNPPDPQPTLYRPHAQLALPTMSFALRGDGDPMAQLPAVRSVLAGFDPLLPVYSIRDLEEALINTDWRPRFTMQLLTLFAALALVLALIGIYAVLSSDVADRRREFGIRMTFGAHRRDILWSVVLGTLYRVAWGIAFGVVGAWWLGRLLASQLYGVSATDVVTYTLLAGVVTLVALLASSLPALRATRVDPAVVLQQD